MPDASGNFRGIIVPRVPWQEDDSLNSGVLVDLDPDKTDDEREQYPTRLFRMSKDGEILEYSGMSRETR